jgi:hypothetical protein
MSELLLLFPAALALCVIIYWVGFLPKGKEAVEKPEAVLPTDATLKKMTKGQLETFGRDIGVELDKRKTKANMIADLKSQS